MFVGLAHFLVLPCLSVCVCAFSVAPLNWLLTGRQDKQISQQLYELAAFFHNVAHTCLFDNFVDILPFSHRWGSEKWIEVESWNYAISVCQFSGATYNYNLLRHRLCKVQRRPPLYKGKDVDQMVCLGELINKYFPGGWHFMIHLMKYTPALQWI